MGNSLGSMFSGYLQAAAYRNLSGVGGLAGWRWLYIIDGVITLPVAMIGFALFPGLPSSGRRWWMKQEELDLAVSRLEMDGRDEGITWKSIKTTLKRPMFWICVPAYM
jgi:ACS family pantothenate transporter-like MFS transporter